MRHITCAVLLGLVVAVTGMSSSGNAGVRVHADVDRPFVLAGSDETIVIKVGLCGTDELLMRKRLPLNVSIVLDKSGSMRGDNKMENAKRGAIEIVERLTRDDILSLVVYDNSPRVIIPAQHVRDKDALIKMISRVYAGGSTALYGGVCFGASEVRKSASCEYINRIILLSDGLANVGPQSTSELADLGGAIGREGITVTTIGVGLDYNEDLMTALAARSDGNAYFASSGRELPRIFAEEIGEAMMLVARDIRIRIDCADGVVPLSVLGRSGAIAGQEMTVTVGKLYGMNEKYALFEVRVPRNADGMRLEVARVDVEYADPNTSKTVNSRHDIEVTYHGDSKVVDESQKPEIIKEAALTRTSDRKREAVALADQGDHAGAAMLIKKNAIELEKVAGQCDNDKELLEEAEVCEEISEDISSNEGLTRYRRKAVVNQAYTQSTQQGFVSDKPKK
ncbi:MAG: VWA domain-containing protein [Candidatus Eisenbacteria bacterium]